MFGKKNAVFGQRKNSYSKLQSNKKKYGRSKIKIVYIAKKSMHNNFEKKARVE